MSLPETITEKPIKVFISYSHDSEEHKWWVYGLSERLRREGIDAIIDRTSNIPGDSLSNFMVDEIHAADKVVVVCTERYIEKAEQSQGGVGFERMIINAAIASDVETNKFVPVIRCNGATDKLLPTFLDGRLFVDMRNDDLFEEKIDELLRAFAQRPILDKSPLGTFKVPDPRKKNVIPMNERLFSDNALRVGEYASSLIRANDFATWQQAQDAYFHAFGSYCEVFGNNFGSLSVDDFLEKSSAILDKLIPFFAFSLSGRNSKREMFCNQDKWLQFLLSPPGWTNTGWTEVIELPQSFAFIYHSMHGAICVKTGQIQAALDIMNRQYKICTKYHDFSYIAHHQKCMGFGHGLVFDWRYLKDLNQQWNWLHGMFFYSPIDYQSALAAYYLALSIEEYIGCAKGKTEFQFPWLYPHFVNVSNDVAEQAIIHLANQKTFFESKSNASGVSKQVFLERWGQWLGVCYKASKDRFMFASDVKYSVYNSIPDALFS